MRASAEALVLFDSKWKADMDSWHTLCPLSVWSVKVAFDETALCMSKNGGRSLPRRSNDLSLTCIVAFAIEIARDQTRSV